MRDDEPEKQGPADAGPSSPNDLSRDDVHRVLASTCRRRLVTLLFDDRSRTRDELATILAGWEATGNRPMATATDRARIEVELHHHHLPLLDDLGVVSYDPTSGRVVLEALTDETKATIERERDSPSARE
ncbi:DUF7344 domain-containing protein [Halorubellus litoreus]|uniref:ArsR family transcriptional regulator n=1 Tax=Halorubellus litoreus TaxID=755308 RepID=A0ABD5VGJ6_9EURY